MRYSHTDRYVWFRPSPSPRFQVSSLPPMRTRNPDSPTRNKLLDAAEQVMLSKGFVAATVDEICTGAGVTKGSFFHYFKNKEELGKVLLRRFSDARAGAIVEACGAIEDPLERIHCVIDFAISGCQDSGPGGCLVGTLAQEISETHPELREVCACCFGEFSGWAGKLLAEAKQRHCPDASFDAESLGHHFLSVIQGSLLVMKTHDGDPSASIASLNHLKDYLRALYGK